MKQDYKKAEEYYIKEANTKIAPKPFGIAINAMNLKEFLSKYEAKYIGEDEHTDGKKYVATNLSQFNCIWRAVITQALMDASSNSKKMFAKKTKSRSIKVVTRRKA